jgi:hypothetical protein
MELNRLTFDKEERKDWQDVKKKRDRAQSDPSPHKPEGDVKERTYTTPQLETPIGIHSRKGEDQERPLQMA